MVSRVGVQILEGGAMVRHECLQDGQSSSQESETQRTSQLALNCVAGTPSYRLDPGPSMAGGRETIETSHGLEDGCDAPSGYAGVLSEEWEDGK